MITFMININETFLIITVKNDRCAEKFGDN
jgi:hypothetical protein